jgi:hypothetical protein
MEPYPWKTPWAHAISIEGLGLQPLHQNRDQRQSTTTAFAVRASGENSLRQIRVEPLDRVAQPPSLDVQIDGIDPRNASLRGAFSEDVARRRCGTRAFPPEQVRAHCETARLWAAVDGAKSRGSARMARMDTGSTRSALGWVADGKPIAPGTSAIICTNNWPHRQRTSPRGNNPTHSAPHME